MVHGYFPYIYMFVRFFQRVIILPHNEIVGGYTGFTSSIRLSVRLSQLTVQQSYLLCWELLPDSNRKSMGLWYWELMSTLRILLIQWCSLCIENNI